MAGRAVKRAAESERSLRYRLADLPTVRSTGRRRSRKARPNAENLSGSSNSSAALDHTRPDRVRLLAQNPPGCLAETLGPPPSSPAGRAVWCQFALIIETALDRSRNAASPSVPKQRATRARQEIGLADRHLTANGDTCSADRWAEPADQATELRNEGLRDQGVTPRRALIA